VRAYQQGDDFRSIDWNVSARMGHPFVKTFHEEREITLLLIVDQSGSCQFGRPYTKAGLAVEVAAVLALAAARHNDRVGALMFADKVEFVVRPAKGRPHALRVIRDLVAFRPRGRGTNLAEALRYAAKLPRHRAIVVVLSDFRADGWEDALAQLAAGHDVVAITIDDPRERELPDAGWVDMEDAETGQRVLLDTSHGPTRTRVRVAAERVEPLGEPSLRRAPGGWLVRYPIVAWTPGAHTLALPPIWELRPDGRADSVSGGVASFFIQNVIPDSVLGPEPRGALAPMRLARHRALPPAAALLVAGVTHALGLRWRRRAPQEVPVPPPGSLDAEVPDARWLAAGEPKAVAARAAFRLRMAVARAIPEARPALSAAECLAAVE